MNQRIRNRLCRLLCIVTGAFQADAPTLNASKYSPVRSARSYRGLWPCDAEMLAAQGRGPVGNAQAPEIANRPESSCRRSIRRHRDVPRGHLVSTAVGWCMALTSWSRTGFRGGLAGGTEQFMPLFSKIHDCRSRLNLLQLIQLSRPHPRTRLLSSSPGLWVLEIAIPEWPGPTLFRSQFIHGASPCLRV